MKSAMMESGDDDDDDADAVSAVVLCVTPPPLRLRTALQDRRSNTNFASRPLYRLLLLLIVDELREIESVSAEETVLHLVNNKYVMQHDSLIHLMVVVLCSYYYFIL